MKAIIWKELRENIRWALLGMVVVGLAMANAHVYLAVNNSSNGQSIASYGFLEITSFLGPALGAALGFMQVIFETRQGHWALLVHRPTSRSRIFLGKVVAGLALYFGAMLIPFLLSAIWAQIPGNVAGPFRWGMAVPGLVDILTGAVYYFAGMLVARRSARWYASRCLPLAAAILCSGLVLTAHHAWAALLTIAVATGLMFVAARGTFIAGGEYEPQRWIAKSSLGAALLVGVVLTGAAVLGFLGSFISTPDYLSQNLSFTSHQLLRDGRVVVIKKVGDDMTITDLNGNPQPDLLEHGPATGPTITVLELSPPQTGLSLNPVKPDRPRYRNLRQRMWWNALNISWYYMPDIGRIEGYDKKTRQHIGGFGPNGFAAADQNPTDRFTGQLLRRWTRFSGRILFTMTSGVYQIDLLGKTIKPMFIPEPGTTIEAFGDIGKTDPAVYGLGMPSGIDNEHAGYAIVTGRRVLLLDPDLQVLGTHTLEFQPPEYQYLVVAKLDEPNGYAFWYHAAQRLPMPDSLRPLVVYGPDGQRKSIIEVPANQREYPPQPAGIEFLGLVVPPGPFAVYLAVREICNPTTSYFPANEPHLEMIFIACMLLAGVVSGTINLLLSRRNTVRRGQRILWTTLGLLLGPSGVLLMLCLRTWPARLRCDGCGVARLVSLFKCEHCGVAFAPPATDGTEIFD